MLKEHISPPALASCECNRSLPPASSIDHCQLKTTTHPAGTFVEFYLGSTPNGTDSTAIKVTANEATLSITAAQFGIIDYAAHRYLTAVNSNAMQLKYTVELW
jgi:hypothetical protein